MQNLRGAVCLKIVAQESFDLLLGLWKFVTFNMLDMNAVYEETHRMG